jgi:lipopolysaccharide transport system ATP-binding protein
VAQGGRAVLFVSHNMGAIRRLTQRCIVLDKGRIETDAPVHEAMERYLKQASEGVSGGVFVRDQPRPADRPFFVTRVTTQREPDGEPVARFDCDYPISICIEFMATRPIQGLHGVIRLLRLDGTLVYECDSDDGGNPFERLSAGSGTINIAIPRRILGPGTYQIYLHFYSDFDSYGFNIDVPGTVGEFSLDDTSTQRGNRRGGFLCLKLPWQMAAQRQ